MTLGGSDINNCIKDIWNTNLKQLYPTPCRAPLVYQNLKSNCLVVVGCNPAYNKDSLANFLKDTEFEKSNFDEFYNWNRAKSEFEKYCEDSVKIERYAQKRRNEYFKIYNKFANELNISIEFLDMFLYRDSDQSKIKKMVQDKHGVLTEFGKKQIELFKEILLLVNPKILLVANAFVCDIITENKNDFNLKVDNKVYYFNETPVFLSSMLTGRRALDKYSRERLFWQMEDLLK